jgi:hypothetical protein
MVHVIIFIDFECPQYPKADVALLTGSQPAALCFIDLHQCSSFKKYVHFNMSNLTRSQI